ncbi:hypothetical protein Lal_00041598 [Lupinus albus]|nr:hypothetical protein Lal_00041598 [Lupinus albus]
MDPVNPTNMDVTINVESTSNPTPKPSQSHVGEDDNTESIIQPAPKKHRSVVWEHFQKIKVNGVDKAECKYCRKQLDGSSRNGTKHLHNHMELCVQKKIMTRGHDKGQSFLLPKALQGKQELEVGTYDTENTKIELQNAIIMHDYPLSILDHVAFRRYSDTLQPLFQVPSRNTIKKETFKVYDFERECAMKMLDSHEGRVAITSDMWTSSNQKRGFIYVPAPHTSDILSYALVECFMDWNINTKMSTITLDNCSSNDAMIPKIKDKLRLGNLLRDESLLHMRCCAHILNLIVKDGLEVVKDGIEKIRDSVAYWNATPKRNEKFEETTKQLNLILDCPTRWNSTYKMLEVAILYKNVFNRLRNRDTRYTCLPSTQCQFAEDICERLKLFNSITEIISGTKYPTANIYFPKICQIKLAISQWMNSSNEFIKRMTENMMTKFEKYWMLDPRYKMTLLEFYFDKLYDHNACTQVRKIRELCYDLVSDYQQTKKSSGSSLLINRTVANDEPLDEYDVFIERRRETRSSSVKKLSWIITWRRMTPDFDILNWWKTNGIMYPTLQAIAKELLAIPISTVASESAFSTSCRMLSPHRSRLNWTTLDALMCARRNMNSSLKEEYVTVLNEIDSDDEAEVMNNNLSNNFED